MRYIYGLCLIFISSFVFATTRESIQKLGSDWAQAIAARDASKITALYDNDAILYATFSNILDSRSAILQYFKKLTQHKDLKVTFTKQTIRLYGDAAINSGLYVFSYHENGKKITIPGRYTFVYHTTPTGWTIIDHHSSVMPEK